MTSIGGVMATARDLGSLQPVVSAEQANVRRTGFDASDAYVRPAQAVDKPAVPTAPTTQAESQPRTLLRKVVNRASKIGASFTGVSSAIMGMSGVHGVIVGETFAGLGFLGAAVGIVATAALLALARFTRDKNVARVQPAPSPVPAEPKVGKVRAFLRKATHRIAKIGAGFTAVGTGIGAIGTVGSFVAGETLAGLGILVCGAGLLATAALIGLAHVTRSKSK